MIRKFTILLPFLAVACATPELPGGFEDEQSWFDARVEAGAGAQGAPSVIPDKTPVMTAETISEATQAVLGAREALMHEERASRPGVADTEAYAQDARERANPPPPID
ncbi:hypothetical protein V0U79_01380 [Hyphobacterium sp. HN65]|uniref:DUF4148 domain-containing protein n=1 Tax=Hyphobacterium lacteum TaxID=3116575 RepID=A0ABU7LM49_9PROT|nr:hypothetical protein [Hyphobacterium sp. HN65]MEE2525000.1 hypothetical protein [Hyphobacterium sp. HN65]